MDVWEAFPEGTIKAAMEKYIVEPAFDRREMPPPPPEPVIREADEEDQVEQLNEIAAMLNLGEKGR